MEDLKQLPASMVMKTIFLNYYLTRIQKKYDHQKYDAVVLKAMHTYLILRCIRVTSLDVQACSTSRSQKEILCKSDQKGRSKPTTPRPRDTGKAKKSVKFAYEIDIRLELCP